jgi:hypothetical protein
MTESVMATRGEIVTHLHPLKTIINKKLVYPGDGDRIVVEPIAN